MGERHHRIGIGVLITILAFRLLAPRWLRHSLYIAVIVFLVLMIITEIIVRYRKSRPIPSMKDLSPEDANAVIGSTPVFLDRKVP
jgi:hypothetical protein